MFIVLKHIFWSDQLILAYSTAYWNLSITVLPLTQITGETVGEVRAVSDMHQRKAEMARHADAFIALPGILYYITKLIKV